MTLAGRRAGDAIAASAGELVRLWRAARAQARPKVFPGLLDGLVEDLFARLGEALAQGQDPALLWPGLAGLVRLDPHAPERSRAELEAEWDVAHGVLRAACDALDAEDDVREWIARAVVLARSAARTLERGRPPGVVIAWALSGLAGVRRPARDA